MIKLNSLPAQKEEIIKLNSESVEGNNRPWAS
jgi:hypothetical protein